MLLLALWLISVPGRALAQTDLTLSTGYLPAGPKNVGDVFDIHFGVDNGGPEDAPNTRLTVTADAGLVFLSVTPDAIGPVPTCAVSNPQEVVCTWATFPWPAATSSIAIETRAESPGSQRYYWELTSDIPDSNPINNDGQNIVIVVGAANNPPEVVNPIPDQALATGDPAFVIDLSQVFSDADGDALSFEVASSNTSVATASINGTTLTVTAAGEGTAVIAVTADDGKGGSATDDFVVTVAAENNAPEVVNPIPDQTLVLGDPPFMVDLLQVFSDPDGDEPGYQVTTSDPNVATGTLEGTILSVIPTGTGIIILTVTASDENGGTATDEFTVTVIENPPSGSISGMKWLDLNANGTRDTGEPPADSVLIYLDLDEDGLLDDDEPSQSTDADGTYHFEHLLDGEYAVREVLLFFFQTFPGVSTNFEHRVQVQAGAAVEDVNFGNSPGILIDKIPSVSAVAVGDTLTFTITVFNPFPFDIPPGLVVEDVLSSSFAPTGATSGEALCETLDVFDQEGVACTVPAIAVGRSVSFTIEVVVKERSDPCNVATAVEGRVRSNEACVTILREDLKVTKASQGFDSAEVGDSVTFTITVENIGDEVVDGVIVDDQVPPGLAYVSGSGPFGACGFVQSVRCGIGGLDIGQQKVVTLTFEVTKTGTICNRATAEHPEGFGSSEPVCAQVGQEAVSYEEAVGVAVDLLKGLDLEDGGVAHLEMEPFAAGTIVRAHEPDGYSEQPSTSFYAGYADPDPSARFTKDGYLIVVEAEADPETGKPNAWSMPVQGYAEVVTGEGIRVPLVASPPEVISGTLDVEDDEPVTPEETITTPAEAPAAGPQSCAILVSGEGRTAREQASFNEDLRIMKLNLTREARGPLLREEDVFVLENPTEEAIRAQIQALRGKCETLYFYYSGHGDDLGMGLKGDKNLLYYSLATETEKAGLPNVKVIIDACKSGSAAQQFSDAKKITLTPQNITLIMSSEGSKSSYTRITKDLDGSILAGTGAFTIAFAQALGDPAADFNNDGRTTVEEAFVRVRMLNPTVSTLGGGSSENTINNVMNPQIATIQQRRVEGTAPMSFPETGLTVVPQASSPFRGTVGVEQSGLNLTGDDAFLDMLTPKDLARRRQVVTFTEEGSGQRSSPRQAAFAVDLRFRLLPLLDSLDLDERALGLAFRTSADAPWAVYEPATWNPDDSTVTALDVGGSGEWVLAYVDDAGAVSVVPRPGAEQPEAFALHANYPNPFNPQTTIYFDVSERAHVRLVVYDMLGRLIKTLVDEPLALGTHQAVFEAHTLPSGVYLYQIEMGSFVQARRMILIK